MLLVAFFLVNAPNCHLSLVLASVVQGDAVNCNTSLQNGDFSRRDSLLPTKAQKPLPYGFFPTSGNTDHKLGNSINRHCLPPDVAGVTLSLPTLLLLPTLPTLLLLQNFSVWVRFFSYMRIRFLFRFQLPSLIQRNLPMFLLEK